MGLIYTCTFRRHDLRMYAGHMISAVVPKRYKSLAFGLTGVGHARTVVWRPSKTGIVGPLGLGGLGGFGGWWFLRRLLR